MKRYCNGCGEVAEFIKYPDRKVEVCGFCGSSEAESNEVVAVVIGFQNSCPLCKKPMQKGREALSRKTNGLKICSDCGTAEALYDFHAIRPTEGK